MKSNSMPPQRLGWSVRSKPLACSSAIVSGAMMRFSSARHARARPARTPARDGPPPRRKRRRSLARPDAGRPFPGGLQAAGLGFFLRLRAGHLRVILAAPLGRRLHAQEIELYREPVRVL